MPDKMIRNATRGEDGLAKALKSDNQGRIEVKNNYQRKLFNTTTLAKGETVNSSTLETLGYSHFRLVLRITSKRALKISVVEITEGEDVVTKPPRVIFDGVGTDVVTVDYEVNADKYYIQVQATSSYGLLIWDTSYEQLYTTPSKSEVQLNTINRIVFPTTNLAIGESATSDRLDSHKNVHGKLFIQLFGRREVRVSIIDVVNSVEKRPRIVYEGAVTDTVLIDYEVTSDSYHVKVENIDPHYNLALEATERLHSTPLNKEHKQTTSKRAIFSLYPILTNGEKLRSFRLNSLGYKYSTLVLRIGGDGAERNFKVSVIDEFEGVEQAPRVIFDGSAINLKIIDFEITSDKYFIEVEATSSYGLGLYKSSYEQVHNTPVYKESEIVLPESEIELPEWESLANAINDGLNKTDRKKPKNHLKFRKVALDIQTLTKGADGYFYVADSNGVLKKYESIIDESEPVETGITLNKETYGDLMYLFVDESNAVFFTNVDNGTVTTNRIYRSDSINDIPTLVYEPEDKSYESIWSRHFGVDSYHNGMESYYLAGTYGVGADSRNLVLSVDGGKTFEVVKQTTNSSDDPTHNSHWHDVEIDYYHGLLWASEGDGDINHFIHYSEDMGKTWKHVADNLQPTSITSYPDKVIFGRDQNRVGLDILRFPDNVIDLENTEVKPHREFKSQSGYKYFSMSPLVYENETYMNFFLYELAHSPMIVASGDYGESWHGVWIGFNQRDMANFICADENYVYAYERGGVYGGVCYSEKPKWV